MSDNHPASENVETPAAECSCCCGHGRRWPRRVLLALLVIVLVGGGAAYWALYARVLGLDVVQSAMTRINKDKQLQQALGQPIAPAGWQLPAAQINQAEKDVRWYIAGPNGMTKAHLHARFTKEEKWETNILEVALPNDKNKWIFADRRRRGRSLVQRRAAGQWQGGKAGRA